MKPGPIVVGSVAAFAACLLAPLAGSAAGPPEVVCPQDTLSFTGTAHDLIVPEGGFCIVTDAKITRDLIVLDGAGAELVGTSVGNDVVFHDFAGADISGTTVGHDVVAAGTESGAGITDSTIGHDFVGSGEESGADVLRSAIGHDMRLAGLGGGAHLESVTIGHDFFASRPQTVQTGHNAPDTPGGPVKVGHDFAIEGSPGFPFVFDGMCNLHVARDLSITDRTVNLGIGLGSFCAANGQQPNTIGRDLILSGNSAGAGFFGPSSIQVANNHIGRDLVFSNNTAVPGGKLAVSGNAVVRDATCTANNPAVTVDAPNVAGGSNTCGYGVSWSEVLAGGVVGLVVGAIALLGGRGAQTAPLVAPLAAVASSFCAGLLGWLGLHASPDVVKLAALVTLLPGMALTIGMRELATEHLQSGVANTANALVQLLGLVFGVGVGRSIAVSWFGIPHQPPPASAFSGVHVLAALAAGLAFTVTLRARSRAAPVMCSATLLAILANAAGRAVFGAAAGVFAAALAVGVVGEVLSARLRRSPLVFIVPGVLILVPGSAGFNSLLKLLTGQTVSGIDTGFNTFVTAMSIAYGLMVSAVVVSRRLTRIGPRR